MKLFTNFDYENSDVLFLARNGELSAYTSHKVDGTDYTYDQLLKELYPKEWRKAYKKALPAKIAVWAVFIVGWIIFGLNYDPRHTGEYFVMFLVALLTSGLAAVVVGDRMQDIMMSRGKAAEYVSQLRAFDTAITRTSGHLGVTLHKFCSLPREVAVERARGIVAAKIAEIVDNEQAAKSESWSDQIQQICQDAELRKELKPIYGAFALIGLVSGGYGEFFRDAYAARGTPESQSA